MCQLEALLKNYKCIGLVGLSKNAGKTTALNRLLDVSATARVGITSIGRDGETQDLVMGNKKPAIYVKEGTLFATAKNLLLQNATVTQRIHHHTAISSPLGDIVVAEALTDGYIDVAGPSTGHQTNLIVEVFKELGVDKVFIDGAFGRIAHLPYSQIDGTVYIIGASHHPDMMKVVRDGVYLYEKLSLPLLDHALIAKFKINASTYNLFQEGSVFFFDSEMQLLFACSDGLLKGNEYLAEHFIYHRNELRDGYILINGPFMNLLATRLLAYERLLGTCRIILPDGTKVFLDSRYYHRFKRSKLRLMARKSLKPFCVGYNPVAAGGYTFDPVLFNKKLRKHITDVPLFNFAEKGGEAAHDDTDE